MSRGYLKVLRRNLMGTLRNRDCAEAGVLIERLREEDPLSVETRGLELEFLVRCGSAAEARGLARQLVELFPASARILHWAGRAAYRVREYAAAEAHFRESGRIAPHPLTDWWLGRTLTQVAHFDEAEALLLAVVDRYPWCQLDLAWLYERRGDIERALAATRAHLEQKPDDTRARRQLLRLQAQSLDPETLRAEVDNLVAFGEEVPDELLPQYVDALLRTGAAAKARELVRELAPRLSPRTATSVAWAAYHLQAYDLALDLFLPLVDRHLDNRKFLVSLEKAARSCRRVGDVIEAYATHAERVPKLHGRIKKLSRHLEDDERANNDGR